jgi:Ca2+-binding RTX toxin-like protein
MTTINFKYKGARADDIKHSLERVINYIEQITGRTLPRISVMNWNTDDRNHVAQGNQRGHVIEINKRRASSVNDVVLAHELLHTLGFGHVEYRARFTIMSADAPDQRWKDALGPSDVARLRRAGHIWHNDPGNTVYKTMEYGDRRDGKVWGIVITDGGGNDTIDLSTGRCSHADLVIDLRPTINRKSSNFTYAVGSSAHPLFAIAKDVVIENAIGGSGSDSLTGNRFDNVLEGRDGDDKLIGWNGNDTLYGGNGNDRLLGDDGNDQLFGGDDNDLLKGGKGKDFLDGGRDNDSLMGGDGSDTLLGGDGNDRLLGDDGNDQLFGENGNDTLKGGAGNDWIEGGAGDDQLWGGEGRDRFVFSGSGFGHDVVKDFEASDKLSVSTSLFADWRSLRAATFQIGSDLIITSSADDTIRLKNVTLESFTSHCVMFKP